jgi:hypothetical protein
LIAALRKRSELFGLEIFLLSMNNLSGRSTADGAFPRNGASKAQTGGIIGGLIGLNPAIRGDRQPGFDDLRQF